MAGRRKSALWTPKRIKNLRKAYGEHFGKPFETQAEFALRLDVDVTTIQHWEQGKGKPSGPAALLLDRLAEDLKAGKIRDLQPA